MGSGSSLNLLEQGFFFAIQLAGMLMFVDCLIFSIPRVPSRSNGYVDEVPQPDPSIPIPQPVPTPAPPPVPSPALKPFQPSPNRSLHCPPTVPPIPTTTDRYGLLAQIASVHIPRSDELFAASLELYPKFVSIYKQNVCHNLSSLLLCAGAVFIVCMGAGGHKGELRAYNP